MPKKRSDGRYSVTATINGKRKYFYGATKKEALQKRDELLNTVKQATRFDETLTLTYWIKIWLDLKKPTITQNTYESYVGIINRYILPPLGAFKLAEINYIMLRKVIQNINLSSRTVNYTHTILKAIFEQAVIDELLIRNPMAKVPRIKANDKKEMVTLTKEQVKSFLSVINNEEHKALFTLAFASGLRRSELLGLRWQDIDFNKHTISVNQTAIKVNGHSEIAKSTKNKSSNRTISIDDNTFAILKHHKLVVDTRRIKTYNWINNDLVFPGTKGNPRNPDEVSKLCKKYAKLIGMPSFTMHGTRHTHATLLIEMGVNFKIIQIRLGHSSFKETMDTYSHVTPILEHDTVEKIKNMLS
ncbi:tyrosine-type recombinase/integrase [Veillonella caviae]|uniref:tyrosine-type recombinase/integrase n=1 Tax=Veillonella caviae TaxID=248316 RepID=UPI002A910A59|nr:tyrosine-type recombinase/integrase [Veillonella caviae]MDY5254016.1 tyrosine-type recombinase/integrase [Veillonella caviae]